MNKTSLFAIIFVISTTAHAAIFGVDNRTPITSSSPSNELARSTAIAVLSANFSINSANKIDLDNDKLDQLCKNERLYNEVSLSYACTAFLIAPDLLATAGHCVYASNQPNHEIKNESGLSCAAFSWLFDFKADANGVVETKNISSDKLYNCKQIIYGTTQESAPYADYALIQLDRPVIGRTPFKINTNSSAVNSSISMIGYPYGTAVKLTDSAKVTVNNPSRLSFLTNLDAFAGNSGSPVLNQANEVVGILIGGTPSANTFEDTTNRCERFNRCDEFGKNCSLPDEDTSVFPGYQGVGSEVQRIAPIADLIKN